MAEKTLEALAERLAINPEEITTALEQTDWECSRVTTMDQAREAYFNTPKDTEFEKAAFLKWLELCTTLDDAVEVYDHAERGSPAEKAALRRMWELFQQEP